MLEGVDFDLYPGEVHVLLGENGAGKSTLTKIISGVHRPDSGQILIDGSIVHIPSPIAAQKLGIALLHQEPLVFPNLDVAENIYMGRQPVRGAASLIDWKQVYSGAAQHLNELGQNLDPHQSMLGLSVANQQMSEMARALSQQTRILIMDEPTASLSPGEVADLFRIMRQMCAQGTAIIFISHRLDEVFEIGDRITVLRDGEMVGTVLPTETDTENIIRMMVGRPLTALFSKQADTPGEVRLEVRNITSFGNFEDISLSVRSGEIVGIAGLVGAGRTAVANAIFGVDPINSGEVLLDGKPVHIRNPREAVQNGLAYVPEDRQHEGLLLPMSIAENITLPQLRQYARAGWLQKKKERAAAEEVTSRLQLTGARSVHQAVSELSGGNQQKVSLSKWLLTQPEILILDEPTRGIDVGAKAEVYHLMNELAAQGMAILMISSELPEILAMSDRILVMREGRITSEFDREVATQEKVMSAATRAVRSSDSAPHATEAENVLPASNSSFGMFLAKFREVGILVFLGLVFAAATIKSHRFLEIANLRNILLDLPLLMITAMGMTMVIISRNIDVSVGSIIGLSGIMVGMLFKSHPEMAVPPALLIGAGIGLVLGSINGSLVTWMRVPSIIATLATMSIFRGLVFIVSGGRQVDSNDLPPVLIHLSQTSPIGIPWHVLIAIAVAIITHLFLRYRRTGRAIYAIGNNPVAAGLRGIPVKQVVFLCFAVTGLLSGVGGVLYASRYGFVNPGQTGVGFELSVIAAAVIGGTDVFGGSGSVLGTTLGCLLLCVINNALTVVGFSAFYQLAVYGAIILTVLVVDSSVRKQFGRAVTEGA